MLEARARLAARVCGKSIYIFRELLRFFARCLVGEGSVNWRCCPAVAPDFGRSFLAEQRIVAPGYTAMQDLVGGVLAHEQRRLAEMVHDQIDPPAKKALKRLLDDTQGCTKSHF
jgi:hypothetical protein